MKPGLQSMWRAIFPRPRNPPTWRSLVPFLTFLTLFAGTCVALVVTRNVIFSSLWPFGLLALSPWLWWMSFAGYAGLPPRRSTMALLIRLTIFCLLIVILAEPRAANRDDSLTVVYALDVSASVTPEAVEQAKQYVSQVASGEKPPRDSSGLVYFGRDAAVQSPPRSDLGAEDLQSMNVRIDRGGSNIAQALSISSAILPESQNGRIVLVTDGAQTHGELSRVLEQLRARKIPVDVLPVAYGYDEEVWIEKIDLPRQVKKGQTYDAGVILSSLQAGRGKLVLQENGREVFSQEVEFKSGKNRFVVPIYFREPGHYEYQATISPATGDSITENNIAVGQIFLEGERQILIVNDSQGDARDWNSLRQALTRVGFQTDVISSFEVPRNPWPLKVYDCVIFPNVPRSQFDDAQLQAVHDAIYHEGVGFLMVGGPNSFGPGGWRESPIEEALPVDMDLLQRKVLLNGALMLVLDQSGSMKSGIPGSTASKQTVANAAAAAAIGMLKSRDWLGVISFDAVPTWIVPFGLNSDPEEAARRVKAIGTGGGTNIYPALEEAVLALDALEPGAAAVRHIVLLTDGQTLPGPIQEIVERCQELRITISTVGVGGPGDVDVNLLQLLAGETGGRFHQVNHAASLPRILIHEAQTISRNAIRDTPFTPEVLLQSTVMKGINAVPELRGMVVTMPKDRTEVVLSAASEHADDPADPLLVLQRFGVGRTAAFTSELSPRWGAEWMSWENFDPFIKQLMMEISRARKDHHLQMDSFAQGDEGVVFVDDFSLESQLLNLWGLVRGPAGEPQQIQFAQVGPRRYEARFPLQGEGRYLITAMAGEDRISSGFAIPYSQEYLNFKADHRILQQIAETTGGRLLTGSETSSDIYLPQREMKLHTYSIAALLLSILSLLIPIDVGVRRVQLDLSVMRSWFSRKPQAEPETLNVLLARKGAVSRSMQRKTSPVMPGAGSAAGAKTTATQTRRSDKSADEDEDSTTTSRLLAAMNRDRQRKP